MKRKEGERRSIKVASSSSVRASISFPPHLGGRSDASRDRFAARTILRARMPPRELLSVPPRIIQANGYMKFQPMEQRYSEVPHC